MEIPKNTTQIGEVHGNNKVFIEDYVISYMKQLCRQEPDRKKRIALYGVMRTEEPQQYFFVYGGSEVVRYGKSDQYLTKQDYEEITWKGESYFEDYVPLGYVTIEDELPEGMYLFSAGKEIYIRGYHIFYEKNESMLTFLIHRQNGKQDENRSRGSETQQGNSADTEFSEKEVFESVRTERKESMPSPGMSETRQRMREKKSEEVPQGEIKLFGIVKSVAAALFIVLCVTAISTMNGLGKMEGVQNYFQQAFQAMKEKKIPDKEDAVPTAAQMTEQESPEDELVELESAEVEPVVEKMQEENLQVEQEVTAEEETSVSENAAVLDESAEEVAAVQQEPLTHVIQAGETLISISKMYYGDDSKVQAICELNDITNSDNIQVGQKIILP